MLAKCRCIGLFEELCKENNCWGKLKEFPSDLARAQYFRKTDQNPDYLPFENTWQQVIIMSGIAGSGKDFYIRQHYPDYAVILLDDMRRQLKIDYKDAKGNGRVIQAAKELAKIYLRNRNRLYGMLPISPYKCGSN